MVDYNIFKEKKENQAIVYMTSNSVKKLFFCSCPKGDKCAFGREKNGACCFLKAGYQQCTNLNAVADKIKDGYEKLDKWNFKKIIVFENEVYFGV